MNFARGIANQLQVVHAVALRETRTRFGTSQLGYFWAFAEPIVWVLTFWALFSIARRSAPVGMDMFSFITTGFLTYDLVMKVAERVAESINGNRSLLFYPHVQPLDLAIARVWLEVATKMTVLVILMGGHAIATGDGRIDDLLVVMLGLGLAACLGGSLGLVLCALGEVSSAFERIRGPLFRPLFWVSGIYFTAASLPFRIRELFLYNPILHCLEMVRAGWFRSYDAPYASPAYVTGWILGLGFFGLTLERVMRRKVQVT